MEATCGHVLKQGLCGVNVHVQGALRVFHRAGHRPLCGQMHHCIDAFEGVRSSNCVPDVTEDGTCACIGEGRKTVGESGAQVIEDGDIMAGLKSDFGRVGSDEPPSPRHQQAHDLPSLRHAIDLCG